MNMGTWIAKFLEELKTSLQYDFLLPVVLLPPFILFESMKILFSLLSMYRLYRLTSNIHRTSPAHRNLTLRGYPHGVDGHGDALEMLVQMLNQVILLCKTFSG